MKTLEAYHKFVDERIEKTKEFCQSNCFGTGLNIAGEHPGIKGSHHFYDNSVCFSESQKVLSYKRLDAPIKSSLVGWTDPSDSEESVWHLGVVRGVNPLTVAHRDGCGGIYYKEMKIEEANKLYPGLEPKYFAQPKLQKILESEEQS